MFGAQGMRGSGGAVRGAQGFEAISRQNFSKVNILAHLCCKKSLHADFSEFVPSPVLWAHQTGGHLY